jgi:ribose 5-phosphate isomerase RpiB
VDVGTLSASSSVKAKFGIIDCGTGVGSMGLSLISSVTTSMA